MSHPSYRQKVPARAAPPDAFVGRQEELASLDRAVGSGARLVSLVGPAGIGKTRLALEYAGARRRRRAGGEVLFCDLAAARDADDVCAALALALDVPLSVLGSSEYAVEQLGRELATRRRLVVVFDNFEQVVHCAPATIGRWLASAPRVRMVVTSRECLRLPGEIRLDVEPLAPAAAVELLVIRAQAASSSLRLTDHAAPALAGIVQRVDGIPLAIELCAARMGVLGPAQLLEQLSGSLAILVGGSRGAAHRQQTLRGAIEWSWNLLSPWEQDALGQCSVFRGGFDLAAAASVLELPDSVGGAEGPSRAGLALQALHDKSLVRVHESSDDACGRRYGLLEGVREYAAERLAEAGRVARAEARHADHYLAVGAAWARGADGHGGGPLRRRISGEVENLMAVALRALAEPEAAGAGRRALSALLVLEPVLLGCASGRLEPYAALLDSALAATETDLSLGRERARALVTLATVDFVRGRLESAFAASQRALLLARETGNRQVEGFALTVLGLFLVQANAADAAERCFDEARALAIELGDTWLEAIWMVTVGGSLTWRGDAAGAALHHERAVRLFAGIDDCARECAARAQLGLALLNLERCEEARQQCVRAVEQCRRLGDRRAEGYHLGILGRVLAALGHHDDAHDCLADALTIHRAVGDRWSEGFHIGLLGNLAFERGALDEAEARYQAAVTLFGELSASLPRRAVSTSRNVDQRYAGLYLARLAAVMASRGRLEEAETTWREAEAAKREVLTEAARISIVLHGGHLEVARARRAAVAGDEATARRHAEAAQRVLAELEAGPQCSPSEEVRFAARMLRRELGLVAPPGLAQSGARNGGAAPRDGIVVGPEARWFQRDGRERVQLLRGRPARLILRRLVEHRLETPGRALALNELFEAGWPGERVADGSAANRVYVTLTKLKKMGLRGLLQSRDDGFLLDPEVPVHGASAS